MLIRRALPPDAPALAALNIACWQEAYEGILPASFLEALPGQQPARVDTWHSILSDPRQCVLLAAEDGEPIGYAHAAPSRDPDAGASTGELASLYFRRSAWGTGRGRELWLAAHNELTSAGYNHITLWVLEANLRGRRFYQSAGFRIEPGIEKTANLGGTDYRKIRMALGLG